MFVGFELKMEMRKRRSRCWFVDVRLEMGNRGRVLVELFRGFRKRFLCWITVFVRVLFYVFVLRFTMIVFLFRYV